MHLDGAEDCLLFKSLYRADFSCHRNEGAITKPSVEDAKKFLFKYKPWVFLINAAGSQLIACYESLPYPRA